MVGLSKSELSIRFITVGETFGELEFFTNDSRIFTAKSINFTTVYKIN